MLQNEQLQDILARYQKYPLFDTCTVESHDDSDYGFEQGDPKIDDGQTAVFELLEKQRDLNLDRGVQQ